MRIIARIWSDLSTGKNFELYPTVLVASVAIIANLVGAASQQLLTSILLGILALLAVALLVNRGQSERIERLLSAKSTSVAFFQPEDDIEEVKRRVRRSDEVWLWGASLYMHLEFLVDEIVEQRTRGHKIRMRVLLHKPDAPSMRMYALRTRGRAYEYLNGRLMTSLERFHDLSAGTGPGEIEIRIIDYLAPYSMYVYDPRSSRSREASMEVRLTTFQGPHSMRPTFALSNAEDHMWFEYFIGQFEAVWAAAEAWSGGTPST